MKKQILNYGLYFILIILSTAGVLYLPIILSEFIDAFFGNKNALEYVIKYLLISTLLVLGSIGQRYITEKIAWNHVNHMRIVFTEKLLTLGEDFYHQFSSNDLLEYFEVDFNKIHRVISSTIPNLIQNLSIISFIVLFIGSKSHLLFVILIGYIICDFLILKKYGNSNQECILKESDYHEQMTGEYGEYLKLKRLPGILAAAKGIEKRFSRLQDDWMAHQLNVNKYYYAVWCISLLLNAFVDIIILIVSGILFLNKFITIGQVYLYFSYGRKVQGPMEGLQQQFQSVISGYYSYQRVQKIFSYQSDRGHGTEEIAQIKEITCKNLKYHYGKKDVLKGVYLNLKSGDHVGFFGKSGDGKSTLCKLLVKSILSNEKSIFVNQKEINCYRTENYIKQVLYFANEPIIFKASFYDNLTMFQSKMSVLEVKKILLENGLYSILKFLKRSDNVMQMIDPRMLSLGQKQILSLLRVFFTKRSLIVFDESFSELDDEMVNLLLNKIMILHKKSIIIIVSHQLQKLKTCKKIYQMQKGILHEK